MAFVPRQAGLRERAATLLHLRPGARYTVRVAALNGVSGPAAAAGATYAQVTVSTGPGGKAARPIGDRPGLPAAVPRKHPKKFRNPRGCTPTPTPTPDPDGACVSSLLLSIPLLTRPLCRSRDAGRFRRRATEWLDCPVSESPVG